MANRIFAQIANLTIIGTLLSLPIVAMYYDVHTLLGIEARTVVLVDTALASPFDYIAQGHRSPPHD
jgi:hypothetical protein